MTCGLFIHAQVLLHHHNSADFFATKLEIGGGTNYTSYIYIYIYICWIIVPGFVNVDVRDIDMQSEAVDKSILVIWSSFRRYSIL